MLTFSTLCFILLPGYHWDTSDWNPSNPLRKIAMVPSASVPDSPRLATSRDSNLHIATDEYEMTDINDDVDSEYVGDSEYCENECGETDIDDDPNAEYPDRPSFEEILALQGELNFGDEPEEAAPPRSYSLHPNQYLPTFNISQGSQSQDQENANYGENVGREDDDDVIHYGFTRPAAAKLRPVSANFSELSDYNDLNYEPGVGASALDNMSVSIGGYTSNASLSDGICEIEDSEANLSDYENGASSKIHTQV